MKPILLSVSLLIFSTFAFSQHFDPGVIHLLNPADYPAAQSQRCNLLGDTTAKTKESKRDMNECAMALCGQPSKNETVFITNDTIPKYMTPALEKILKKNGPMLDSALKKINKDKLQQIKSIEKNLLPNGAVKIDVKGMDPYFNSELSKDVFGPYIKKDIDLKRPLKNRLKLIVSVPEDATPEFKSELSRYATDYEKFLKYDRDSIAEYATESEAFVVSQDFYSLLKKSYMDARKKLSAADRSSMDQKIKKLDARIKDKSLIMYDVSEFEMEMMNNVSSYKSPTAHVGCNFEASCQKIFENYLADSLNIKSVLESLKKDLNNPDILNQQKLKCTAGIISAALTSSNMKKANELFLKVKKDMTDNVFSKFSEHSRGVIKKHFDTRIDTNYKKSLEADDVDLSELQVAARENLTLEIMNQEDAYKEVMKMQDNGVYDVGMGLCQDGQSAAWDAFLPHSTYEDSETLSQAFGENDQMFVSPFTTLNEKSGKAIIAHELGHALSYVFKDKEMSKSSAATYNKLRQCATGNYLKDTRKDGSDGQNTEEDTADLISYMTYQGEKDIFLCALLQPSSDNKSYVNLEFLEKYSTDRHSTSFYRAYLEAVNKGMTMPISCQKAFEPYASELSTKKCL